MKGQTRIIGEISGDTRALIDRLSGCGVGEEISYQELSTLLGRSVRNGAMHSLRSALKYVQREHNSVFGVLRGCGLKRLSDEEIVKTSDAYRESVRRKAKRGALRLTVVDYEKLPPASRVQHNTMLSFLGAIYHMGKPASIKKLQGCVERAQAQLPLARTLKAFED